MEGNVFSPRQLAWINENMLAANFRDKMAQKSYESRWCNTYCDDLRWCMVYQCEAFSMIQSQTTVCRTVLPYWPHNQYENSNKLARYALRSTLYTLPLQEEMTSYHDLTTTQLNLLEYTIIKCSYYPKWLL